MIGDLLLMGVVVALGGWAVSALRAARRGDIVPPRCPTCHGLVSRADPRCRHCGAGLA